MAKFRSNANTRINHAIQFASMAHGNQVRKGNEYIPYIFHSIDVANEVIYYSGLPTVELEDAAIVAILHDVVEDTHVRHEDIEEQFGVDISNAVSAMSKNEELSSSEGVSKENSLRENIERLRKEPRWVQAVKLADRVSNLKSFPRMWDEKKIAAYLNESRLIAEELGSASEGLKARLLSRIADARVMLSLMV